LDVSNALEFQDVSKRYGQRWALARLSFVLSAGGSLLLTGHNGSGKTTLLRLLATLFRPTTGRILLFGQDAVSERDALRPRIALLGHTTFLYEELTARENCVLLARLLGRPAAEVDPLLVVDPHVARGADGPHACWTLSQPVLLRRGPGPQKPRC